jgi:hypothetical protein
MNLSLLQRPKRVNASSDAIYIYAPSVLMEGSKLKPGTYIKVLEVHKGDTPDSTTLKVMEANVWERHYTYGYGSRPGCKLYEHRKNRCAGRNPDREKCECEGPVEDMQEKLREATHFVLLSDIGR